MPKLTPEAQARRNETYRRTMAAKRAVKAEQDAANDLVPAAAADVLAAKSVAEVLARRPLTAIRGAARDDPRLALAGEVVRLLLRVLQ